MRNDDPKTDINRGIEKSTLNFGDPVFVFLALIAHLFTKPVEPIDEIRVEQRSRK